MEKVSFKKAVLNDRFLFSASLLSIIFFIVSLGLFVSTGFELNAEGFGSLIVIAWFLLSFIFFILRLSKLLSFKSDERKYTATVTDIYSFRSSRQITFTYLIQGEKYKNTNVVIINKESKKIRKGELVEINISMTNPKNSLIRDIYFDVLK